MIRKRFLGSHFRIIRETSPFALTVTVIYSAVSTINVMRDDFDWLGQGFDQHGFTERFEAKALATHPTPLPCCYASACVHWNELLGTVSCLMATVHMLTYKRVFLPSFPACCA